MIRDTIVQVASTVFTVACLVYVTYVIGYVLCARWGRTPPPAPETFEEFWQQLESRGASYTEGEAEALYALYQERRGQVISSTDGQIGE
jgi:hypothetical protein